MVLFCVLNLYIRGITLYHSATWTDILIDKFNAFTFIVILQGLIFFFFYMYTFS